MNHLDPSEYLAYGLAADTQDSLVASASAMIDAFCRRPSLGITQYIERLRVARDGRTVRLSNTPLAAAAGTASAITAARVRLRRLRDDAGFGSLTPLQQAAGIFGLCGTWSTVDPAQLAAYGNGEVEFPVGFFTVPFDEAEVTYTAGFAALPTVVKYACAQIVKNALATPALNVKRQRVDAMEMDYFKASLLDDEVQRMLRPYLSVRLG